jgi:tripartite-type tricarboxylate transporter receptor subunit TctC
MAGQSNLAIAPHLVKQSFDPLKDFIPVTRMSIGSIVLVVNGDLPVRTVAELVDYAKRNPGKLNAASWGNATITHLALELFNQTAGVQITHVPYKGGPSQYLNDLVTDRVQVAFEFYPAIGSQVKAGRLRAVAVSGRERVRLLPDVPTFTEAGLREMETVSGWQGVAVPARTPQEIVGKLQAAIARVLAQPDVRGSYLDTGFDTVGDSPEEFAAFIRSEQARWGKLIADAGIRID